VNTGRAATCMGTDERRAGQKKGHGVAADICFECDSVAGEGGSERGP
jgi:hypothetical protein